MEFSIDDWSPLAISLKTAVPATVVAFFLGIAAACLVVRMRRGKNILDAMFMLPLVLPPTVIGFLLVMAFSKYTDLGTFLLDHGIRIVNSQIGVTIAITVVSFPLMYRAVRGSLESFDENMTGVARTLGMSEAKVLRKVVLPNILPGLVSGGVLTFARALGEYGAAMMVGGCISGKTVTMSIAVGIEYISDRDLAYSWTFILIGIAATVVVMMNWFNQRQMRMTGGGR
ncbi:MAG: molybdate ABC transporter permease subunit [Candidatus Methanoplasma sp.]|jgi:molybdate transport system permease protein|nr:molybdate ABC transporter permease subunit [Candidatus Methanoplasma sp.]